MRPQSLLASIMATMAAICREITHASFPLPLGPKLHYSTPTLGRVLIVLAELVAVLVLCFYALHPGDEWQWEDIGYRTGFVACAQLPLVFLLASKNNIIGFLVGASYERLNWLHRWTARVLFLTVTIHMGFWFADWYRFDYIKVKLTTDAITQRGFAAWIILLWIVVSSMAPVRSWNYEFFVIQHIVTFSGLIAAVYLHLPAENKVWIWIPIGLLVCDRFLRWTMTFYNNLNIFHLKMGKKGVLACKATFEPLDCETTRITIVKPPVSWQPGQHVLLSCHAVAPLQSHPFTVASMPADDKMVLLVKCKLGSTKRFLKYAEKQKSLPLIERGHDIIYNCNVLIEGPYGRLRPFRQFDSVFLIAGSSGGIFTIPLLREIVHAWKSVETEAGWQRSWYTPGGAATRYIRFVWVIKSRAQYQWFADQLGAVAQDVEDLKKAGQDCELDMSIYVTCDEEFASSSRADPQIEGCGAACGQPEEVASLEPSMQSNEELKVRSPSVMSVSSKLNGDQASKTPCGPDGACCCQATIEDEDVVEDARSLCQCCCGTVEPQTIENEDSHSTDSTSLDMKTEQMQANTIVSARRIVHPSISTLSGRPQPKNLIRKMLGQALGESAVVVCGPCGLVNNVRQSVVALSDERAVHKGTGAQGIYLHAEAFEY